MLQHCANNTSYSKTEAMGTLNAFVAESTVKISKFLNALCDLDDFDSHKKVGPVYSRQDRMINISLNEIYDLHRTFESLAKTDEMKDDARLSELLTELGPAPETLPRSDDVTVHLELFR